MLFRCQSRREKYKYGCQNMVPEEGTTVGRRIVESYFLGSDELAGNVDDLAWKK